MGYETGVEIGVSLAESLARDDPLYKVLGKVGVKERSLDPTKLLKYALLLQAPAVEARVGPDASMSARAQAAAEVIEEAVASIEDPKIHRIAEAVFCTDEVFVGEPVGERKRILADEGIDHKTWRTLRPLAIAAVSRQLHSHAQPAPPEGKPAKMGLARPEDYLFDDLVSYRKAALTLGGAGLAALFALDLETSEDRPRIRSPSATPEFLLDAAAVFAAHARRVVTEHPYALRQCLIRTHNWEQSRVEWLKIATNDLLVMPLGGKPVTKAGSHKTRQPRWIDRLPPSTTLETLTALAGAVGNELAEFSWQEDPARDMSDARRRSYHALTSYYRDSAALYTAFCEFASTQGAELVKTVRVAHS